MHDLRSQSDTDLSALLAAKQTELAQVTQKVAQQQLKNVRQIRVLRTTIARILTILSERNHAISQSS